VTSMLSHKWLAYHEEDDCQQRSSKRSMCAGIEATRMAFKDAAGAFAGLRLPRTGISWGMRKKQRGPALSSYKPFGGPDLGRYLS
jgi:hypothetical protein